MILGVSDIGYKIPFDDACRLVERFWQLGGRAFDTAHTYAHWVPGMLGSSERALCRALRAVGLSLDEARITTKGGHPDNGPLYPRPARYLDAELVRQDLAESLERLETGSVDAFLLHRDDPSVPVEEIAALLESLRAGGLARHVGVSNWAQHRVAALRACLDGVLVWQNQCSLALPNWSEGPDPTVRRFTPEDFAWAAANNVTCCCYSATANGYFATGAEGGPFDTPESRARRKRARVLALRRGATANQVALAWLMAQPGDVRPIIGTTGIAHLEEAMAARDLPFSVEERDGLGAPVAAG